MSEVTLRIPMDSLMRLPSEAEYRAKDGQANASVRNENGTVVVYATCDSLQIMCEYYERKYNLYKNAYEEQTGRLYSELEKKPPNPFKAFGLGVLAGVILAVIVLTIVIEKKK